MFAVEKTATRPRHPGTRRASADANHCVKRRRFWLGTTGVVERPLRSDQDRQDYADHRHTLGRYQASDYQQLVIEARNRETGLTLGFLVAHSAGVDPPNCRRNPLTGRRRSHRALQPYCGTHDIPTMAPAFTVGRDGQLRTCYGHAVHHFSPLADRLRRKIVAMVTSFLAWWIARIIELLPFLAGGGAPDGVVVAVDASGPETASLRRKGRGAVITMKAAAGRARRRVTCPASVNTILQTRHILPTASRRDTKQMLRHLLGRITPFSADALFWSWEGRRLPLDPTRTEVTLTMVPKMAVAPALDRLATAGIRPHFLEVGDPGRPRLLPIQESGTAGSIQRQLVHGLVTLALASPERSCCCRSGGRRWRCTTSTARSQSCSQPLLRPRRSAGASSRAAPGTKY